MQRLIFLALFAVATPASAQLVAPLTTSEGKIACTQGSTGVGRATRWEAVADTAALGGWALAETAGDATDLRFPLCVSTQTVARDVDATLRFKIVSGTRAQVAGLMLRAQSGADYYVARASATDGTVLSRGRRPARRTREQEGTGDPGRTTCAARDRQARPLRDLLRRHVAVQ